LKKIKLFKHKKNKQYFSKNNKIFREIKNMEYNDLIILKNFIQRSTYRERTLKSIKNGYENPTLIAKDANIDKSHISRTLKELLEKNLIQLLNPESKKGRIYIITELGDQVLSEVERDILKNNLRNQMQK
jgi:predicted transcriptional regulator